MDKRLLEIKAKMDKQFGFNAVRPAVELEEVMFRIPTGSISLDIASGGGVPGGMMTHIAGDYSAGKSALLYHILANAQKMQKKEVLWEKYSDKKNQRNKWILEDGGINFLAALIQFESHSYANDWGMGCGLDIESLLLAYPDGLEEGVDIATALQREHGVDIIGIDSYAAALPSKVIETDASGTNQMAIKPKILQDYHGRYQASNNKLSREGSVPCTLVVLNQIREKIGGFSPIPGQAASYSPGGKSKDFTSSLEVHLRKGEQIALGSGTSKNVIGQQVKFKITKNKTFIPFKVGSYDFYFAEGGPVAPGNIDNVKEIATEASVFGVIEQRGAYYYYGGKTIAQGTENLINFLRDGTNAMMLEEIRGKLMKVAFEKLKEAPPENDTQDEFEKEAMAEEKPKRKLGKKD